MATVDRNRLEELLYEALETEQGGIKVYETAVRCARNDDLVKEWSKYLDQTRNHEVVMLRVLEAFGLDAGVQTPGRRDRASKGRDPRRLDGGGAGRRRPRPRSWSPRSAWSRPRPRTT